MYGRVPIVTSYEQPQDEVVQSERSEVFRFIVNEWQEVAELLPNERSNKMAYQERAIRRRRWYWKCLYKFSMYVTERNF